MRMPLLVCLLFVTVPGLLLAGLAGADEAPPSEDGLPGHFAKVTDRLYRSAQPTGEATFKAIAAQGIKVVVSLDGARPDLEAAAAAGITYVHIPIGYEGVPREKALQIAKVVTTLEGPFLFHCHHGKHRGPAGCAIAWRVMDGTGSDAALAFLKEAGTSPKYAGLFRDVAGWKMPAPEELAALPAEFPSYVPPQGIVGGMVAADHGFERLTLVRKSGWRAPASHPDVNPPHEATILAEAFREMARLDEKEGRSDDWKAWMKMAEDGAWQLSAALAGEAVDAETALKAFNQIQVSCTDCHTAYRNNAAR